MTAWELLIAAGLLKHSDSRVIVPRDSWSHFTVWQLTDKNIKNFKHK
jgi:hypothetical protein